MQEGSVIKTILEKIAGSNPDTVIYRIARCMTNASSTGMNQIVYTHTFDTIIDHYYSNDYKTLPTEPKEPYILNEGMEYLSDNMMGLSVNSFMNLTNIPWKFTDASGIFWRQEFPDCWNYATFDDYTSAYFFYKGLGGPYYSWMGPALNFSYNKLVYYKKGSETWGTPLDCDSLLQVSLQEFPEQLKAKIYPNPTFGTVTVSFPAGIRFSPRKLEVIDVSGRLSATFNMSQQTLSFDLGDLPSGLYTYKITSVKGDIIRGKIIKQ